MRPFPSTVKITFIFLGLVAIIWLFFGVVVIFRLHPAFPQEPIFRWGIGITAIFAGLGMMALILMLFKRRRFSFWLLLIGLFAFTLATIFDEVGLVDMLVAGVTLIPAILMIKDRRWYLQLPSK